MTEARSVKNVFLYRLKVVSVGGVPTQRVYWQTVPPTPVKRRLGMHGRPGLIVECARQ